jgi:hypothetical protein
VVFIRLSPTEPLACEMRISTGPSCCLTLRKPAATCFASETSVETASTSVPISAASLPMNSGERANMPTRQPSPTSLRTSAVPSPGPTPATIATRLRFLLAISCWVRYCDAIEPCARAIQRVPLPVAARARGSRRWAIATHAVHEMAKRRVSPELVRAPRDTLQRRP